MKDLKISKELLSEVLQTDRFTCDNIYGNIACLRDGDGGGWDYNIYEFAFRCKEWALIRGYSLLSGRPIVRDEEGTQVFNYWYKCYIWEIDENSIDSPTQNTKIETDSETEPEAIIKACEWILNNK